MLQWLGRIRYLTFFIRENPCIAGIAINFYPGSLMLGGSIFFFGFKETTTKFLASDDNFRISAFILRMFLNFLMKRKKSGTEYQFWKSSNALFFVKASLRNVELCCGFSSFVFGEIAFSSLSPISLGPRTKILLCCVWTYIWIKHVFLKRSSILNTPAK